MKEALELIGAVVITIVILGIPVLSFVSFAYDWHGFLKLSLFILLVVDFLFILSKLMEETE